MDIGCYPTCVSLFIKRMIVSPAGRYLSLFPGLDPIPSINHIIPSSAHQGMPSVFHVMKDDPVTSTGAEKSIVMNVIPVNSSLALGSWQLLQMASTQQLARAPQR